MDIELAILVVDGYQAAFLNPEQVDDAFGNSDLQISSVHFRNASRTFDELVSTAVERNKQDEFSVRLFYWAFKREDISSSMSTCLHSFLVTRHRGKPSGQHDGFAAQILVDEPSHQRLERERVLWIQKIAALLGPVELEAGCES